MLKRFSNFHSDLGLQLLGLYILLVGPIIVGALLIDQVTGARLEREVRAGDLALARAIAHETDTVLANALRAVEQLAGYSPVRDPDIPALQSLFAQAAAVRPDINLIYRLGPTGIMLYHYPEGPDSTVGVDFAFREYFQRALNSQTPLMSLGRISPTTQQPVATAVMPLWDETGAFLGVVATNIRLESFSDTLAGIAAEHQPEEQFEVMILDASGKVIAHPDSAFLLKDLAANLPMLAFDPGVSPARSLVAVSPDGEEMLYSLAQVTATDWKVVIIRPTAVAFATPQSFHQSAFALVGIFVGIGLFFWVMLSRRVIEPLGILTSYSQAIARSQLMDGEELSRLATVAQRPDQIGHLARNIDQMNRDVQARFKELSTLLETSAAVVSTLDSHTVLQRILEQVDRLLGFHQCAIVAFDETANVFRARATRGLSGRHAEELVISPDEARSPTMRAIRTGRTIIVTDEETSADFLKIRPQTLAEGYRSIAAIPLTTTHAPPSALVIYSSRPKTFSAGEINLLASFANHAAMAIENAALYARSDARLQQQTRRLEALVQSMDDGLVLEDLAGQVLYVSRSALDLCDLALEEIIGHPVSILLDRLQARAEDSPTLRNRLRQTLADGDPEGEVEFSARDGARTKYLRLKGFKVTDSSGELIGRGQLLRDVTKRHELDRMKNNLISTASHELRTPLAAIKGYATTLLADDVEWDRRAQSEFLEIISTEADRLTELVSNLLDLSRIEAGNLALSMSTCRIQDVIQSGLARAFPSPMGEVLISIPDDLPFVEIDCPRIEAVIRNLVENAIKYAGEEQPIVISAALDDHHLVIRVQDCGPGIPPEASESAFAGFYRLDDDLHRRVPGTGLGLSICRGFVEAHGGRIWLEPSSQGARVAFSLPLEGPTIKQGHPPVLMQREKT